MYKDKKGALGILCWETGSVPKGLRQLEGLVGNSTNLLSYDFPVIFSHVKGANMQTVLEHPDPRIVDGFVKAANKMIQDGASVISTSCGFNVIFQQQLAAKLSVPVFTSSLLQVPFVCRSLKREQSLAIVTANKMSLTKKHLQAAGITSEMPVRIWGLEKCPQWNLIFTDPERELDLDTIRNEVIGLVKEAIEKCNNIGAFVLECTDLPPFSEDIRRSFKLPVFDFMTMVKYIYDSVS